MRRALTGLGAAVAFGLSLMPDIGTLAWTLAAGAVIFLLASFEFDRPKSGAE